MQKKIISFRIENAGILTGIDLLRELLKVEYAMNHVGNLKFELLGEKPYADGIGIVTYEDVIDEAERDDDDEGGDAEPEDKDANL
jgi:hypothetical protein